MRIISRNFKIFLFLSLVLVPFTVSADDFEDDFIDAESFEQDNQIDNQSDADFRNVEENQNQIQENNENEGFTATPSPDPEQAYADQDPEPLENEGNPSKEDDKAGLSKGSSDQEAQQEPLDYTEDLEEIINLIQNLQFTLMIVTGIIIGFFFITRLLP